jgi:hypothetical protein
MTVEPPVFEERRQTPDRRQFGRRVEDRAAFMRTAVAAAVAICGGLVVVYLFFGAIGAVDFGDAAAATVITIAMAAVWLAGYWFRHRAAGPGQSGVGAQERERRGF